MAHALYLAGRRGRCVAISDAGNSRFSKVPRLVLGTTQPPNELIPLVSVRYAPASNTQVDNEGIGTSIPNRTLVLYGDSFRKQM